MGVRQPHSGLRSIAVLSLAALFFLLAMGITITATGVYRSITAAAENHFSRRTALSYVMNELRRGDASDAISITSFGDGDALSIDEQDGYSTLLYCWEGHLMELYADTPLSLSPEDGEILLDAKAFSVTYTNDLLTVTVTDADGTSSNVSFSPRCGMAEVHHS